MTDPRLIGWDVRIVFVQRRQSWWWNAWRQVTCTELHGFAASPEEAAREMYRAIEEAGAPLVQVPRNDHPREIES